uniref:Uncharacterized protein n=1 Tax=Erythrolobus madagascarensis TaxID=708628 RepID=A0A7S0XK50_9RHOD|mmetsp:Transcript_74/g.129  ORF Transcript_74/g.129 Transcript_74/m.129 type:complete len:127 (+) Transcript_74:138-518(+)
MKLIFAMHNEQHELRRRVRTLVQKTRAKDSVFRFRELLAQIVEMAELDQVDYVMSGLKRSIRTEFEYRAPNTLLEAIDIALKQDTSPFRFSCRRHGGHGQANGSDRNQGRTGNGSGQGGPTAMEFD